MLQFYTKFAVMHKDEETSSVGMCLAMLLKFRYPRMDMIHIVIPMIMYAGHCGKHVHDYLILHEHYYYNY